MRGWFRAFLGIALVAHGLANAVLPLRGVDAIVPGLWSLPIAALYVVAIVGFVAAGLGVLGVRPLTRVVLWTSIAAGAAALLAALRLGDADLWVGVILSALLPVAAVLWTTKARVDERQPAHRAWRVAADAIGLAFLAWVAVSTLLWPWHRSWGTANAEWAMALPGDKDPRAPAMEIQHGVTIEAPPSAVWPWLVQIGQDRAGFYSYERLERLFGVDVRNVTELRPEWQTRMAGDFVRATQPGYLGGLFGDRVGWTIDAAEPNRALVLRYWGAFVLQPTTDGHTRFLIRSTISNREIPAWLAAVNFTAFELPHFIMQRRMMLNIKALAEQS